MKELERRNRPQIQTIAAILVATILWTFCGVGSAVAGWDDNSGDLPGMDNDLTPVFIAGGVLLVLVVVWKMKKGGGEKSEKSPAETKSESGETNAGGSDNYSHGNDYLALAAAEGVDVESLPSIRPLAGISKSAVSVGVSFGF